MCCTNDHFCVEFGKAIFLPYLHDANLGWNKWYICSFPKNHCKISCLALKILLMKSSLLGTFPHLSCWTLTNDLPMRLKMGIDRDQFICVKNSDSPSPSLFSSSVSIRKSGQWSDSKIKACSVYDYWGDPARQFGKRMPRRNVYLWRGTRSVWRQRENSRYSCNQLRHNASVQSNWQPLS